MSAEKSEAIVIRMADFSESSRVVTLFTRDFGKIAAVAKGAKRIKGPFQAALDLLSRCQVVFLRKSTSGLDILTEAQLVKRFTPQAGRLNQLYAGYYVAELLDALNEEYDAHPTLYDEAVLALDRLSGESRLDLTVIRFELVILREIGQLPSFDACVFCGEPVATGKRYGFKALQGGVICSDCWKEEAPRYQIHPETTALLQRLAEDLCPDFPSLETTPAQSAEVRAILNNTISHVLGRRPKMQRYLSP